MKTIRNATRFLVLAAAAVLLAARAEATPIISVVPHFQSVLVGDTVSVDIDVSGLTQPTGAVSFLLNYDNSILHGATFTPDPDGVMGVALNPLFNNASLGFTGAAPNTHLDAFFAADLSFNPAALALREGAGFRLANVTFSATNTGLSPLTLLFSPVTGTFLSDFTGQIDLGAVALNGCVLVNPRVIPGPSSVNGDIVGDAAVDPCPNASAVPEPATFGLLATGLAALVRRRRKPQA